MGNEADELMNQRIDNIKHQIMPLFKVKEPNMTEELKSCPFCGVDFNDTLRFVSTIQDLNHYCRTGFLIQHKYKEMAEKDWNNAYCWKRIESLEAKLEVAIKGLKNCSSFSGNRRPEDGCRLVILEVRETLERLGEK